MPKKKVTIEDLAVMVKKGFDGVDKKFDEAQKDRQSIRNEMREGFKKVDERFKYTNSRLDVIERDIKGFVNRDEFEDLLSRMKLVEKTLGIKV